MTTVTVAQFLASEASLDAAGSFTVKDTAANISAALNALNADSHAASIVASDSGLISVSVAQLLTDTRALGVATTAAGAKDGVKVVDTAADISHAFSLLFGDSNVKSLEISDNGTLWLPSSLFYEALSPGLYGRVLGLAQQAPGAVKISPLATTTVAALEAAEAKHLAVVGSTLFDTTADVVAGLGRLAADSNVAAIYLSDSAAISLSAAEVAADARALAEIVNPNLTVNVVDTAANISADLDALASVPGIPGLASLVVSDNAALTLTAAKVVHDAKVLGEAVDKNGAAFLFNLDDTAANLSGVVAALAGDSHLGAITVTDGLAVQVAGATWAAAGVQAELAKITGAHAVQINWGVAQTQDTELLTYNASDKLVTDAVYNQAGGPETITVDVAGQSFTQTSTSRPTSFVLDAQSDSFVLHTGFGADVVIGYAPGADSFSLDHAEVASFTALLADAKSDGHGDVVVTLSAHDSLTLDGITLAQLQAHAGDWHFI
jgi:hypothetical protein